MECILYNKQNVRKAETLFKDTRRGKNTLKQNSSAQQKYEYEYFGSWYIKSTI